jgi:hypothetical protein
LFEFGDEAFLRVFVRSVFLEVFHAEINRHGKVLVRELVGFAPANGNVFESLYDNAVQPERLDYYSLLK